MRHVAMLAMIGMGVSEFVSDASAQTVPDFGNVPYAGHPQQKLDIYLPEPSANPLPVIVWIHGGGWQTGDKDSAARVAQQLVGTGFVVVALNYRYAWQAPFPAQLHDCRGAIRWIRAHAIDLNIDAHRIGVWGENEGGHLAALLGVTGGVSSYHQIDMEGDVGGNLRMSSRVQAVADVAGQTDFFNLDPLREAAGSPESELVGFPIDRVMLNIDDPGFAPMVRALEAASPVAFASEDDPPFYIVHGESDSNVQLLQSLLLDDALVRAGGTSTFRRVTGATQRLPGAENLLVREFFRRTLALPGDVNYDNAVDVSDLFGVIEHWGGCSDCPSDLDGNGEVDSEDLFEVISNWTQVSLRVQRRLLPDLAGRG